MTSCCRTAGGVQLLSTDIDDWQITFVDTGSPRTSANGSASPIDIADDEMFLANYADGLSDLPRSYVETFGERDATACFMRVHSPQSFHIVHAMTTTTCCDAKSVAHPAVNAGFFVLRRDIFDYLNPGEELVLEPFQRLIEQRRSSPCRTTASGRRWTRSRTRSSSTRSWRRASHRGSTGLA